jgi:hypothetical protein
MGSVNKVLTVGMLAVHNEPVVLRSREEIRQLRCERLGFPHNTFQAIEHLY